jgi:hypothetical protein
MFSKRKGSLLLFFLVAMIPFVFILLPADFFDQGQSLCLSVLLFDTKCYGCGMTKALQHLMHLEVSKALSYNMISLVVLPALFFLWGEYILKNYRLLFPPKKS